MGFIEAELVGGDMPGNRCISRSLVKVLTPDRSIKQQQEAENTSAVAQNAVGQEA